MLPPLAPTRRWHRRLGIVLLLPFLGWAVTGLVFFLKPGYAGAYAELRPHFLPLGAEAGADALAPHGDWLETRRVRTVLGEHLLVRTADGRLHLHAENGEPFAAPDGAGLQAMIADAIAQDPARYGTVARPAKTESGTAAFETTTGVHVEVDWPTLTLRQRGPDTERIDALYRVHYLQWTGVRAVDRVVGIAGLAGLVALALLGLRLALR